MEKMNLSTWNSSLIDEFLVLKVPVLRYESKNHQWSIHKVFKYLHNCWVKRRTEVSCYQRTTTCNNDIESGDFLAASKLATERDIILISVESVEKVWI